MHILQEEVRHDPEAPRGGELEKEIKDPIRVSLVSGTREERGLGPYLSCSRRSRGTDGGRFRDQSKSGLYEG